MKKPLCAIPILHSSFADDYEEDLDEEAILDGTIHDEPQCNICFLILSYEAM